jgi:hypothetical protein
MALGEVLAQYREMRQMSTLVGRRMNEGTLAAKKSNLFPPHQFTLFANALQQKEIANTRFGI